MPEETPALATTVITKTMMSHAARSCVSTMEILNTQHGNELSTWHLPYYLLAATALELFPKLYLAKVKEKDNTGAADIESYLRSLGHDLEHLYSEEIIGQEFLLRAHIKKVETVKKGQLLTFFYSFHTDFSQYPIQVYHLESLRYGAMAGQRTNAGFAAWQFDELLELCKNVQLAERSLA
jgi:hypothetical protein